MGEFTGDKNTFNAASAEYVNVRSHERLGQMLAGAPPPSATTTGSRHHWVAGRFPTPRTSLLAPRQGWGG